MHNYGKAV